MTRHKFAIGQIVDFDTRVTPLPRPRGPYEVMRVLPAEDVRSRTYRIKSKAEPFERSAKEYEIVAVSSPATERAAIFGEAAGADRTR
ncbi:MAG: hypothetical protein ACLPSW_21995 [Roseiarcus sp.]|jgi:hypothetical protein